MREMTQIGPGFMRTRYYTFVGLRVAGFLMVVAGFTSLFGSMCMIPVIVNRPGQDPTPLFLLMLFGGLGMLFPGAALMLFSRGLSIFLVPLPAEECPGCGYSLRDIESDRCPECGVRLPARASRDGGDAGGSGDKDGETAR